MKKLLSSLFIIAISSLATAQTNVTEKQSTEQKTGTGSATVKTENYKEKEQVIAIQKEITQIDSHLKSIEIKRQHILADPAETKIAQENGWFDKMKATEDRLLLRKNELQQKLNQ